MRIVTIEATFNVGCTQCGQQATQILAEETGLLMEIVEAQCADHAQEASIEK